ncbi:CWF complex protein sap62 [Savitreella phatthalungensis]
MDYQNRAGSKFGGGGVASSSDTNAARKERLRKLAAETIDLARDPYIFRNHLGKYECRLCMTIHANDGSYLVHTQGRKHQQNLARRVLRDQIQSGQVEIDPATGLPVDPAQAAAAQKYAPRKDVVRIGRPGYKVQKVRQHGEGNESQGSRIGLFFQVSLPEIEKDTRPRYRIMSAFEQQVDAPADPRWQYLVIAADPYDPIAFKIPNVEIDRAKTALWDHWDSPTYTIQLFFKRSPVVTMAGAGAGASSTLRIPGVPGAS